jgi:hypothetical protein
LSWKKYFTPVPVGKQAGTMSPLGNGSRPGPARSNYSSFLPDVYAGTPNRVERYMQYETMDMDSEVNAALDILAEFCTQANRENNTAFQINFKGQPTSTEVKILKDGLQKWTRSQQFETRMFRIVRNVFKYGDVFFIKDPETQKWYYVDPSKIVKIIVNESEGKKPEQYVVRDINFNFRDLVATSILANTNKTPAGSGSYVSGGGFGRGMVGAAPQQTGTRFSTTQEEIAIDAKHIVHLSLSEGLDNNYPFGNSLLESVFKVYKQKELLEDAIIIYRVQRAPERRVFYIDVGNMPAHMAMSFVERVKNEINQRRIPSQSGGGQNMIDASYNPLSISEDYFFPQTAEGRGSKVDTLPGGTNLGEIDDLRYFTNKLFRALRIPSSYLPTMPDDSQAAHTDGKVGTAYIQELRFNEYCKRLQSNLIANFDLEFKEWLIETGINIDNTLFELKFNPPQNFAAYRQSELDNARVQTFAALQEVQFMSKRFALKRFLGLSQEEITENEKLWKEENGTLVSAAMNAASEMRSVGVTPAGISSDMDAQDAEAPDDLAAQAENPSPEAGGADPAAAPSTSPAI